MHTEHDDVLDASTANVVHDHNGDHTFHTFLRRPYSVDLFCLRLASDTPPILLLCCSFIFIMVSLRVGGGYNSALLVPSISFFRSAPLKREAENGFSKMVRINVYEAELWPWTGSAIAHMRALSGIIDNQLPTKNRGSSLL
jgi:hypothetical protein